MEMSAFKIKILLHLCLTVERPIDTVASVARTTHFRKLEEVLESYIPGLSQKFVDCLKKLSFLLLDCHEILLNASFMSKDSFSIFKKAK